MKPLPHFRILPLLLLAASLSGCGHVRLNPMSEAKFQRTYATPGSASKFLHLGLPNSAAPIRVHYRDEGTGPTLVLLHGICDSLHTWDRWAAELKPHFRLVRVDYPPFGLTGGLEAESYDEEHWIAFLDAFLAKLRISRAHLAGNSLGGSFAWRYAAARPDLVTKLVLINPAGFIDNRDELPFAVRAADHPLGVSIMSAVMPKMAWKRAIKDLYLGSHELDFNDPDTEARYRYDMKRFHDLSRLPNGRNDYVRLFQFAVRMAEEETDEEIGRKVASIRAPVLILWGAADPWFPPSAPDENGQTNLDKWRRYVPNLHGIEVYEGVGHMPQLQIPEQSAADVRRFLSR